MEFNTYLDLIVNDNKHVLIAGCTGSGKSVFLNNVLCYILTIDGSGLILIDPKKVELAPYRNSNHTIMYGDDEETIAHALQYAVGIMDARFSAMQRQGIRKSTEAPIYIIIDELAQFSRTVNPELAKNNTLLSKLATLGRAANVFLIACTQRPTNDVITPLYKINCDCKVALRTSTKQESRNIIDISDAYDLPDVGYAIIRHPKHRDPFQVPVDYHTDKEIEEYIRPTLRPSAAVPGKEEKRPKTILGALFNLIF